MKINVGDYVRTRIGIGKITSFDGDLINIDLSYRRTIDYKSKLFGIVKSSPNIIDLIQYGDIVNNKIVGYINDSDYYDNIFLSEDWEKPYETMIVKNQNDIKSIITREQIEHMSYKVVE